jgi:hypothetical protein
MSDSIIEEIKTERQNQDIKWGEQDHSHFEWLAILGEEFGELSQAVLLWNLGKSGSPYSGRMRDELIQLVAVGIAWLECIERRRGE